MKSLFVSLAVLCCAVSAEAASHDPSVLLKITKSVDAEVGKGNLPVVIFDLDDTLFDTRARHLLIMERFAEQIRAAHPRDAVKLRKVTLDQLGYSFVDNLDRAGVSTSKELRKRFREYWVQEFFGDACAIDPMIPGAGAYVRDLYRRGALVVYLTGRDPGRMARGTVDALLAADLPFGIERTELIMKPSKDVDDESFKQGVVAYLQKLGTVVGAFENEPFNINLLKKGFPKADAVFLDTRHKPTAPQVDKGIVWIGDYLK